MRVGRFVSLVVLFGFLFGLFAGGALAAGKTVKKWTLLFYINADNNLNSAGLDDVNEMEKVGSTEDVNIVAMLDTYGDKGTKVYFVQKDSNPGKITSPVVRDLPEQDMGSEQTLVDFFKWGVQNYPAEHYFVAIWNHGAGWIRSNEGLIKGISYDDDSHNHMSTPELGKGLKQMCEFLGRPIDIIGYDACLMQMAEVAWEVRKFADIEVGSEETEPGDGWPYDDFIKPLVQNPDMTPAEFAAVHVTKYGESYNGGSQGSQSVTQSAVDLKKLDDMAGAFDEFCEALIDNAHLNGTLKNIIRNTQSFYYSQYKDLGHFLKLVMQQIDEPVVKEKAKALYEKLCGEDGVIIANSHVGSSKANAMGLSIWMPSKSQLDGSLNDYRELQFSSLKWDEFIQGLYYPNIPVITVAYAEVTDEADGVINPGDTLTVKVTLKNDGLKPSGALKVSVEDTEYVSFQGEPVVVDGVPAASKVVVPAFTVKLSEQAPLDTAIKTKVKVVDADGKVITYPLTFRAKEAFEVKSAVLLLSAKKTGNFVDYYKKALEDAGIAYDFYPIDYFGKPGVALLKNYVNGVVIFFAPGSGDVSAIDTDVLAAYLDKGGSLFITGQDVGYKLKGSAFYSDYLHAKYVQDNTGIHTIEGKNEFAGMTFSIKGGDGANNQKWPDEIDPIKGAEAVLVYAPARPAQIGESLERSDVFRGINGSGTAAVYYAGAYKVLYMAFGFEAVSKAEDRAALMKKVVDLLKPTLDERLAAYDSLKKRMASLEASGFAAAASTAQELRADWARTTAALVKDAADVAKIRKGGVKDVLRLINAR